MADSMARISCRFFGCDGGEVGIDLLQRADEGAANEDQQAGEEDQHENQHGAQLVARLLGDSGHLSHVGIGAADAVDRDVVGEQADALRDPLPLGERIGIDAAVARHAVEKGFGFLAQAAHGGVFEQARVAGHERYDEQRLLSCLRRPAGHHALAFEAQHFEVARQSLPLDGIGQGFVLQARRGRLQDALVQFQPGDKAGEDQPENDGDARKQCAGAWSGHSAVGQAWRVANAHSQSLR